MQISITTVWRRLRSLAARVPGARWLWNFVKELDSEWRQDRCGGLSAEIAFWLVLSIFPGLLLLGAMIGWLDGLIGADLAASAEREVVEAVGGALGAEAGPITNAVSDLFAGPSGSAFTFGLVFVLLSASRGFNAVVGALDQAYEIETSRSWFHTRVTALFLGLGTIIVGASMLVILLLGPLFAGDGTLGSWFNSTWNYLGPLAALVVLVAWSATIYHIAPLHRTPWKWELPGAVFASMFFIISTLGFRIYLDSAIGGANAILGAVGTMLTLLIWVYTMSVGFMLGAEVNQIIADRHGVAERHVEHRTVRGSAREVVNRVRTK